MTRLLLCALVIVGAGCAQRSGIPPRAPYTEPFCTRLIGELQQHNGELHELIVLEEDKPKPNEFLIVVLMEAIVVTVDYQAMVRQECANRERR